MSFTKFLSDSTDPPANLVTGCRLPHGDFGEWKSQLVLAISRIMISLPTSD